MTLRYDDSREGRPVYPDAVEIGFFGSNAHPLLLGRSAQMPPLMGSPSPGFGCALLAELPYSPWRIGSRNPSLPIARSPQPRPLGRKRSRRPALRARPARALPRACPVSALHLASADPIRSLSHAVVQDGTAQSNRGKNTGISTKQPKGRSCRRCLRHSRHSVGRLRFCRLCTAAS